jgi:hypothetical protein
LFGGDGGRIFIAARHLLSPARNATVRVTPLVLLPLLLSACKVEPTPRTFYNHRDPAVVERQEGEGEIRSRVTRFVAALNRGDSAAAVEAVNPSEQLQVMGPTQADSMAGLGATGLLHAIGELRLPSGGVARTPDLRVASGQSSGWFATHVVVLPMTSGGTPERFRLSGVFAEDRGEWRLVEVHLAQGSAPASPDSTAAPSPDSSEARAGGE